MALKAGMRLRSQVDTTELIVVKPPAGNELLTCGGHPMVDIKDIVAGGSAAAEVGAGTAIGKRYTTEADPGLEVLVTKAGACDLALGHSPLALKQAKPLPASD